MENGDVLEEVKVRFSACAFGNLASFLRYRPNSVLWCMILLWFCV